MVDHTRFDVEKRYNFGIVFVHKKTTTEVGRRVGAAIKRQNLLVGKVTSSILTYNGLVDKIHGAWYFLWNRSSPL